MQNHIGKMQNHMEKMQNHIGKMQTLSTNKYEKIIIYRLNKIRAKH